MKKVPVYVNAHEAVRGSGGVVGYVTYNTHLDPIVEGRPGQHMGIARLRKPRYMGMRFAVIHGSDYEDSRDIAILVSDSEAQSLLLQAGRKDLVKEWFNNVE